MMEADYYTKLKGSKVRCELCPMHCEIHEGKVGNCKVRKNISGKLFSLVYDHPIALNIDPIEKKPLYHFLPGSKIYSIGTSGCNLHCNHCQNWDISQNLIIDKKISPKTIVNEAKNKGCNAIAYTYTEPTIFYEYMLKTAKIAKKEGLRNVIVSNGFINEKPLRELCKYIDAANIDLKSIRNNFYREECSASIDPILSSLKILREENVWLEITTLLIPNLNDSMEEIRRLVKWIKNNLGVSVPLHFTAFYPCYKRTDVPPTPPERVKKAREIAINQGMEYVYAGNIIDKESNYTICPKCGKKVINRDRFSVENNLVEGKCPFCNNKIAGVFD